MVRYLMSPSFSHDARSHALHLPLHARAEETLADSILAQAGDLAAEDLQQMVADILHQDDSDLHLRLQGGLVDEEVWNDMISIDPAVRRHVLVLHVAVHDPTHRGRDHLHREDAEAHQLADPAHRDAGDEAQATAAIVVTVTRVEARAGAGVEAVVDMAGEGDKRTVPKDDLYRKRDSGLGDGFKD